MVDKMMVHMVSGMLRRFMCRKKRCDFSVGIVVDKWSLVECTRLRSMPDEVLMYIFSFLSVPELCAICLVCRDFKAMALDNTFWKRFFIRLNTQNAPSARVCHSSLVYGDKMYVYGGHVPDVNNYIRDVKNDFYSIQMGSKKWELVTPKSDCLLPYKTEHTAVLYKNCMYLFGGYSGSQGYRDTAIYEFNFDTKQCTRIEAVGQIPPDRSAHVAAVYGDNMYIMGGWDGAESNNDFYKYNFETRTWKQVMSKGATPPKIRSHSCVLYEDSLVIFGGYGENKHPGSMFRFHFPTQTWEEISCSGGPCGRSRFRMVFYDNSLWCFGGWDRKQYFNDLWRFRLDTRTWHKIEASFDLQGVGQHSLSVHQGLLYLYGGYCADTKLPHEGLYVHRLPPIELPTIDTQEA